MDRRVVARFAADLGERAIECAAEQLGFAEEIEAARAFVGQVEHGAEDVIGGPSTPRRDHPRARPGSRDRWHSPGGEDVTPTLYGNISRRHGQRGQQRGGRGRGSRGRRRRRGLPSSMRPPTPWAPQPTRSVPLQMPWATPSTLGPMPMGMQSEGTVGWTPEPTFQQVDPEYQAQFEEAAAAQKTFQKVFQRQVDVSVARIETIRTRPASVNSSRSGHNWCGGQHPGSGQSRS